MNGAFDEVDFNTTCPGANCGRITRRVVRRRSESQRRFRAGHRRAVRTVPTRLSARVDRWDNSNAIGGRSNPDDDRQSRDVSG
jgi:hypothetical protein